MSSLFGFDSMVFLLGLVILHFIFFAIPAFHDYTAQCVAVEELEEDAETLPPPVITLCPYKYWFSG